MNDSNDNQQDVLVGSREPTKKNWLVAKVILLFVLSLAAVGGLAYVYYLSTDKAQDGLERAYYSGEGNPTNEEYQYKNEADRQRRLKKLEQRSIDDFSSDDEMLKHYGELNKLLALDGRCSDYEKNVDAMAKKMTLDSAQYISVGECYQAQKGSQADVERMADKAEAALKNAKSDDSEYYKDRIRYLRWVND